MNSPAAIQSMERPAAERLTPSPFPRRITIELSSACNLSCIMCPRKYASPSAGLMGRDLFERIVEELNGHPLEAVVPFFRGETLLHPDFLEMMTFLRRKTEARIQLATNALLLTADLGKALLELGIDFISFSLDAVRRETYEKIRLGSDFERVMENVHTFLRLREDCAPGGTVVQVSATEGPYNEEEIPDFIRYWKGRVDRVRIYARHSDGGRYGRLAHQGHRRPEASRGPCRKPFTDLVIYADGYAALCNHDWDRKRDDSLGSMESQSIGELWNGNRYGNVRKSHLAHEWQALNPCGHCDHWQAREQDDSPVGDLVEGVDG
jgi:MoaA/NifB/PqqE/SkfB family radical SAM enzyme